jgi:ABC-type nitrate/sulfonate/bicarbonate transport system permease component
MKTSAPTARRYSSRRPLISAFELAVPILLVSIWWFAGQWGASSFYFPPLSTIWPRFIETWFSERFIVDVVPTLTAIVLGYAVSVVAGVALGIFLARYGQVYRFFAPLLELFRAMPGAAMVPILIILIGVDLDMKIALVAFSAIWPVMLNTVDGVRGIDPTVRDTASSYRIDGPSALFRVTLPAASPQIIAGMRTALSQCIILIIISEMVVSASGIGNFISQAEGSFDLVGVWSGILLLALVGFTLNKAFQLF